MFEKNLKKFKKDNKMKSLVESKMDSKIDYSEEIKNKR